MLKISEVYEKQIKITNEKPDGSEYLSYTAQFDTRDCLINPSYIVAVRPYDLGPGLAQQRLIESFPEGSKFSTLILDGNSFRKSEVLVLGSFEKISGILKDF
mgnify:CR=1 FL=1